MLVCLIAGISLARQLWFERPYIIYDEQNNKAYVLASKMAATSSPF